MAKDGHPYTGFLYAGLMIGDGPDASRPLKVLEYNCRMGDPETEVVIPRIKNDLVELLEATARGKLSGAAIETDPRYATTIVAVSGGYPEEFEKGFEITGLENSFSDGIVFHAGTKAADGRIVTNGGRVLCATALANDLPEAIAKSKKMIEAISYKGKYFRRDIGYEFSPLAPGGGT
jgi:phosphoribosylamine--glycine ligase